MQPILELDNISFKYTDQAVLKNISIKLEAGKALGILGPNGGGKTTLLKIIVGLLQPTEGRVLLSGKKNIAYIPQKDTLNELLPLTVYEVLEQGEIFKHKKLSKQEKDDILNSLGLEEKGNRIANKLSGGEKQRVLIARALVSGPDILVLDEPNKGLDSSGQDQLFEVLENIKKSLGTSLVIVDHNLNQIIKHSDQVICLNKTFHWHDHKDLLTEDILEEIYHCEFEHLKIHELVGELHNHHQCSHHGEDHSGKKEKK